MHTVPMTSGIVLGAGGIIGPAYHLSVLRSLRDRDGADPSAASLFVGTSGGAIIAGLLASGFSVDEVAAAFDIDGLGQAPSNDLSHAVQGLLTVPALAWGRFQLPSRLPHHAYPDARQRRALWTSRLFAGGDVDPLAYASPFEAVLPSTWPSRLRICAMHVDSGNRRVFGPDDGVPVVLAAAASCAVPGMFRAVTIEGEDYSDGGYYSPTNADVALGFDMQAVTISSPMTSPMRSLPVSPDHPIRVGLHAVVNRERRNLRQGGACVTLVEPDVATRWLIGGDYMNASKGPAIAKAISAMLLKHTKAPQHGLIA